MIQILLKLILLIFTIFLAEPSMALRCGNNLVIEGTSQFRVLATCGQPSFKNTYYAESGHYHYHGADKTIDVMEKWTYNFGSRRLLYVLLFRNGVLEKIETDRYGFASF